MLLFFPYFRGKEHIFEDHCEDLQIEKFKNRFNFFVLDSSKSSGDCTLFIFFA